MMNGHTYCLSQLEDYVLFNQDCLETSKRIPDRSIDLIYVDPPFFTDRIYEFNGYLYQDKWKSLDEYIRWVKPRLKEFKRVLKANGTIYIHCDWHVSHYLKVLADEVFDGTNFLNEIIWKRQSCHNNSGQGSRHFGRIHDTILVYTMSPKYIWNQQYSEYEESYVNRAYRHLESETERRYALGDLTAPGGAVKGNPRYEFLGVKRYWRYSEKRMNQLLVEGRIEHKEGRVPLLKRYLDEMNGRPIQDLWTDIKPVSGKKMQYPTQKPESLLKRIICTSSRQGQLVYDPFAGSSTSGVVSFKLSRNWIGSDISEDACRCSLERLQKVGCKVSYFPNLVL